MSRSSFTKVVLLSKAVLILFQSARVGSGRLGSNDGNSDNRANSAQLQMNLPTRAELGKSTKKAYIQISEPYDSPTRISCFLS